MPRGAALAGYGLHGNRYVPLTIALVLVLQLLLISLPPFQALFGTAPLDTTAWLRSTLAGAAQSVVIEAEKAVVHRSGGRRPDAAGP